MLDELKTGGLIALAVLAAVLGAVAWGYQAKLETANARIEALNASIKRQNDEAADLLAKRTQERDRLQATLDAAAAAQEETDAAAKQQIAALRRELGRSDVRVRVAAGSCGPSGGGADGQAAGAAGDREGNPAAGTGLLPAENTRRLADALAEMETISAAYASCRKQLFLSKSDR